MASENHLTSVFNKIFTQAQQGKGVHIKCIKQLQIYQKEVPFVIFYKEFFLRLKKLFLSTSTAENRYQNRGIIFAAKFCVDSDKSNRVNDTTSEFLTKIIKDTLKLHLMPNYYYACMFLNKLLLELGENEAYIDEELCLEIKRTLLQCLNDTKPKVRCAAVEALGILQIPTDPSCEIISSFISFLTDSSALVRRTIICKVCLNPATLPSVLKRILDIDAKVRIATYEKICKYPVNNLDIEKRQHIVKCGVKDKCPHVNKVIKEKLIPLWLKSANNDIFDLILLLKLDAEEQEFIDSTEVIEMLLTAYFEETDLMTLRNALELNSKNIIPLSKVMWELVVYWRCFINFIKEVKKDDLFDDILPELSGFVSFFTQVYESRKKCNDDWEILQHDFILMELFKIVKYCDHSDEVGRTALTKFIESLLSDGTLSFKNLTLALEIYEGLIGDVDVFVTNVCNIVSEIREPLTVLKPTESVTRNRDVKLAEYRMKIEMTLDKQEVAINTKDFQEAHNLKEKIAEYRKLMDEINKEYDNNVKQVRVKKNDNVTLCKCMNYIIGVLMCKSITKLPNIMTLVLEELAEPALRSNDVEVFLRGIKLLGYSSCFDKELAKKSMSVFTAPLIAHKFMPVYNDAVTITVIECITDLTLLFGKDIFSEDDEVEKTENQSTKNRLLLSESQLNNITLMPKNPPKATFNSVVDTIAELLDDNSKLLREKVAESLVKLLCMGKLRSSKLLSKLILKWFIPPDVNDQKLRQYISRIFIEYAREETSSPEAIEEAIIISLETIGNAPINSPIADIDVDTLLRVLSDISRPGYNIFNGGLDTHKHLALTLCNKICSRPNNKLTVIYLKQLLLLEIPYEDKVAISDLEKQVVVLLELLDEEHHKLLLKFRDKLQCKNLKKQDTPKQPSEVVQNISTTLHEITNELVEKTNEPVEKTIELVEKTNESLEKSNEPIETTNVDSNTIIVQKINGDISNESSTSASDSEEISLQRFILSPSQIEVHAEPKPRNLNMQQPINDESSENDKQKTETTQKNSDTDKVESTNKTSKRKQENIDKEPDEKKRMPAQQEEQQTANDASFDTDKPETDDTKKLSNNKKPKENDKEQEKTKRMSAGLRERQRTNSELSDTEELRIKKKKNKNDDIQSVTKSKQAQKESAKEPEDTKRMSLRRSAGRNKDTQQAQKESAPVAETRRTYNRQNKESNATVGCRSASTESENKRMSNKRNNEVNDGKRGNKTPQKSSDEEPQLKRRSTKQNVNVSPAAKKKKKGSKNESTEECDANEENKMLPPNNKKAEKTNKRIKVVSNKVSSQRSTRRSVTNLRNNRTTLNENSMNT